MTLTCAYYRNRFDGSLWALRAEDTRVVAAVGPLPPHAVNTSVPMEHKATVVIDVTGWSTLGFEQVGRAWKLHGRRRHVGRPRVDCQEHAGGFEVKLIHPLAEAAK